MIMNTLKIGATLAGAMLATTVICGGATYGGIKLTEAVIDAVQSHEAKRLEQKREVEEIERKTGLEIVSWQ